MAVAYFGNATVTREEHREEHQNPRSGRDQEKARTTTQSFCNMARSILTSSHDASGLKMIENVLDS